MTAAKKEHKAHVAGANDAAQVAGASASRAQPDSQSARPGNIFTDHLSAFPASSLLVALNLAVFAGVVMSGARGQPFSWRLLWSVIQHPSSALLLRWGANFGPLTTGGQWWRLVTAIFLHVGIWHLLLNMWALFNVGALSEFLFGRRTLLFTFFATGLAGSLTSLAWNPLAVSAGASGAIFGIAGALLVAFRFARLPLSKGTVSSATTSLVLVVAYTLYEGLRHGGMDNAAHIGGLCAGLIVGAAIVLGNRENEAAASASENERGGASSASESARGVSSVSESLKTRASSASENTRRQVSSLSESSKGRAASVSESVESDGPLPLRGAAAVALAVPLAIGGFFVGRAQAYVAPLERGRSAMQRGDFTAAIADLRRAVAMRPKSPEPKRMLGEAYLRAHQVGMAQVQLTQAVTVAPKDAKSWDMLGMLYLATGRGEEAVYALSRGADLDPKNANAQADYAFALQAAGRLDDSLAAYHRALQLDPHLYGAQFALGVVNLKAGKLDDAVAALQTYTREQPADSNGYMALSEAYKAKGMSSQADDAARRAAALRPNSPMPRE